VANIFAVSGAVYVDVPACHRAQAAAALAAMTARGACICRLVCGWLSLPCGLFTGVKQGFRVEDVRNGRMLRTVGALKAKSDAIKANGAKVALTDFCDAALSGHVSGAIFRHCLVAQNLLWRS
jgi:hypothetical protein